MYAGTGGNAVFASTTQMGDSVAPPDRLAEPEIGVITGTKWFQ